MDEPSCVQILVYWFLIWGVVLWDAPESSSVKDVSYARHLFVTYG